MNIAIQKRRGIHRRALRFPSDAKFCLDFKRRIEEYCAEIGANQKPHQKRRDT